MTLKHFPINYVCYDIKRFKTNERELRDYSNVPKQNIEKWVNKQNNTHYEADLQKAIQASLEDH